MPWRNDPAKRRRDSAVYGSAEYRRNRRRAWQRADGACEQLLGDGRRCISRNQCQVDHITPVSQGGTHHLDNLHVLCGPHHRTKTAQEGGGYRRSSASNDPALQIRTQW